VYGCGEASLAERVLHALEAAGQTVATAESCTGGLIAETLTEVPGASRVYRGSVIAYENDVKVARLDVEEATLNAHGAVSEAVATQIAEGARTKLRADWAIFATGIAGPGDGTLEKPIGTVCIALAGPSATKARTLHLPIPERERFRSMSSAAALRELLSAVGYGAPAPDAPGA
jgi:nicotinamide-nucleotide amidase